MNDECLFCKIIKGELPSYKLYEDEEALVFLDIFPVSKGHSLLIPKNHYETIHDVPEEDIVFLKKLPKIASKIKSITAATGINILQSNGEDAGQVIKHLHFHIIPRFPEDGLIKFPPQSDLDEAIAKDLVEKFKNLQKK